MTRPVAATIPALITGASSGLGAEFARQLGARGHDLTLVARRGDRLEALAGELREAHGIGVTVLIADLETSPGVDAVVARLREKAAWLLVNNAGFGSNGRFQDLDPMRERAEVALNVSALHSLCLAAAPGMVRTRRGGIINVASTAAFQPIPYMATYAATKAFVLSLSEGLAGELARYGVRVMALCPGATRTEFGGVAGNDDILERGMPMSPADVVGIGLRAFDRGDAVCITGLHNRLGSLGARVLPRAAMRRITSSLFAPR